MKRTLLLTSLLTAGIALTAQAQNIFIDFGGSGASSVSGGNWNDLTDFNVSTAATELTDFDTGSGSGVSFEITSRFHAQNVTGLDAAIGDFASTAVKDSFYIQTGDTATIAFTGFDFETAYEFTFVATRDPQTDNRSTLYELKGKDGGTGAGYSSTVVNASTNGSATAENIKTISVVSDEFGVIALDVSLAAANNSGFGYLGGIQISSVPEPSTYAAIAGLCALGSIMIRRRR